MENNKSLEDYKKKWQATLDEWKAKVEGMSAEARVKYYDETDNLSKELEAMSDLSEAKWKEFSAKARKWWQDFQAENNI